MGLLFVTPGAAGERDGDQVVTACGVLPNAANEGPRPRLPLEAITALPGGGFETAFQANTSDLWTVGSANTGDWHLGMAAGTSPAITGLSGGGFETAFQANTSELWTVGSANTGNWHLGMATGTSPTITGI